MRRFLARFGFWLIKAFGEPLCVDIEAEIPESLQQWSLELRPGDSMKFLLTEERRPMLLVRCRGIREHGQ